MIDNLQLFEMVRQCLSKQTDLSTIIDYLKDRLTDENRECACDLIRAIYRYINQPYIPVSFCPPPLTY